MTTTIDILPDDVLVDIFVMGLYTDEYTKYPQIKYSHVCRRWRSLTLSYPFLWNNIHLESIKGKDDAEHLLQISKIFFQRSSPLLVNVVIKDRKGRLPLLKLLEPYISRIRSLDLDAALMIVDDLDSLMEMMNHRASNLRSLQLPRRYDIDWSASFDEPSTEGPPPYPMQLESLGIPGATCLTYLPFPVGSVTHLELKLFFPTRWSLAFLFHSMPALSSLAIDLDHKPWTGQHHNHSQHDPAIDAAVDIAIATSTLIPGSSSLQKLALHFGWEDIELVACMSALELLDVQNVKYLELQTFYIHEENPYQSIIQVWRDRLVSLETFVLSPVDLLGVVRESFIRSSHPAGINLAIDAAPTFDMYENIRSSFPKIASITYYLKFNQYTWYFQYEEGVPEEVKACNVSFPITFIPTSLWCRDIDAEYFPIALEPTDDEEFFEPIDFIRHFINIAKGGQIPVRFIPSRHSLPTLLSETEAEYLEEERDWE